MGTQKLSHNSHPPLAPSCPLTHFTLCVAPSTTLTSHQVKLSLPDIWDPLQGDLIFPLLAFCVLHLCLVFCILLGTNMATNVGHPQCTVRLPQCTVGHPHALSGTQRCKCWVLLFLRLKEDNMPCKWIFYSIHILIQVKNPFKLYQNSANSLIAK